MNLFFQVANEELWEGIIVCGTKLLKDPENIPWEELGPSENWPRRSIIVPEEEILDGSRKFFRALRNPMTLTGDSNSSPLIAL